MQLTLKAGQWILWYWWLVRITALAYFCSSFLAIIWWVTSYIFGNRKSSHSISYQPNVLEVSRSFSEILFSQSHPFSLRVDWAFSWSSYATCHVIRWYLTKLSNERSDDTNLTQLYILRTRPCYILLILCLVLTKQSLYLKNRCLESTSAGKMAF